MERRVLGARLRMAALLGLVIWAGFTLPHPAATHAADSFTSKLTYSASFSSTLAGSTPTITTTIAEDCPLGPAACPASSSEAMPDVLALHYSSNIVSCTASKPLPCNGDVPFDATVGTVQLHANTNIVSGYGADNVNPTTGAPAACGAAGTAPLSATFTLYNARNVISLASPPESYVSSRDSADVDNFPDTQADSRSPGTAGANGIPDGADAQVDAVRGYEDEALFPWNTLSRAYGVLQVGSGAAQIDVHLLTLDLTGFGGGYAEVILFGDPRSKHAGDPNVNQSVQLCTPFAMTITQPGISGDSFGTSWTANGVTTTHSSHETPTPVRTITGSPTDAIHYGIEVSSAEDADRDGVQPVYDKCPNVDVGVLPSANALTSSSGTQDGDGDGMGDSCDPDPATADNCPGVAFAGKSALCNAAVSGGPNIGLTYPTHAPWDPDQDIDGDGFPNWSDNCPTVSNPSQLDVNADGVGDACQVKPYLTVNPLPAFAGIPAVRCPPDCPIRPANDHDDFCDAQTTVGGATPTTVCYVRDAIAPTAGIVQDSDDDGFPDYLVVPGFSFSDKNGDADWDGCSDYTEVHSLNGTPCGGTDPRRPNTIPTTPCAALVVVRGLLSAGGGSVTYTSTTLSDTNISLVPDTLVGMQVNALGSFAVVASNSSSQLTLAAAWQPSTPPPGAGYTIGPCVEGNKDRDNNGTPDWKDNAADTSQQDNTANPNGGSPDSDGDGCTSRREALPANPIANGGGRDGLNTWDFYDVLTNNAGLLSRNRVVSIADTIAIMQYIGISAANPSQLNNNGHSYAGLEPDGSPSFEIFDRSPSTNGKSGPPDGAVTIADALNNLNQIGANCSLP